MKRGLLIIALGLTFLVVVTGVGTFITNYMPTMNTPQSQTTQAGPYTVTLRVDPNPPSASQPATFSIQVVQSSSHQPLDGAHVTLEGAQEDMGVETSVIEARAQGAGMYEASVPFSTSGSWQMQVAIAFPDRPEVNAAFSVTAQ